MGDMGYWDAQGQRLTPAGTSRTTASPSTGRIRSTRPSRAVVRQLLALFDA